MTVDKDKDKVLIVLPYLGPMSNVMKRNVYKLVIKFYPSVEFKVRFYPPFLFANINLQDEKITPVEKQNSNSPPRVVSASSNNSL